MKRLGLSVSASAMALLLGAGFQVQAQTPLQAPPPETYRVDERGVDLTSGKFIRSATLATIGDPGAGGLSYIRTYFNGAWRDNVTGTLTSSGTDNTVYSLSIGGSTDVFIKSGTTFTPTRNVGQTLTQSGTTYTYTMPDGTVATFSQSLSDRSLPTPQTFANQGRITRLVKPNGETTYFTYETASEWGEVEGTPVEQQFWAIRLRSVRNNQGYSLFFKYELEDTPDYLTVATWRRLAKVTAYNLTDCSSTPFSQPDCSGSAVTTWPSATFSGGSTTDQSGRTTFYGNAGGSSYALRLPENPTVDALNYVYDANLRVTSVKVAGQTWTYAYSEAGGVRTVSITDPNAGVTVAKTDIASGQLASYANALGHTTSYTYDSNGRVSQIKLPANYSVAYQYDGRGNVTRTTVSPRSLLIDPPPSIVTSAVYPATCVNRITCNFPESTTDERGGVTNYTYDPTHGGLLTVTAPAPTSGATRPQTRITYAPQTAWYKDYTGAVVASGPPITLPVSTSACATGFSCAGTADEVKTSVVYGTPGVSNNLQPSSMTSGAGDGSLTATTAMTYTAKGDLASVDGPMPGTADTTTYRYDDARQVVGVIGPDPDAAGPLLHRAQRVAYNASGQVTRAEVGTVTDRSDANWTAFASLQQSMTTYDVYGRPTHQRLQSGSTTHALTQVSFDNLGRIDCTALRMNPATFASPPALACTAGTVGTFGPDRITKNGYDAASRLTSTTSGLGVDPITESVTYNPIGQARTLTDGKGNLSTIEYDGFGRPVKMLYPNPASSSSSTTDYEEYTYDAASNVLTYRNRGGDTFTSGYDALGRQTSVTGGGMAARSFSYDNLDRTTGAAIAGGASLTRTWDALGRMTSETQNPLSKTVAYQYDLAGRRTRLTWPDGFFVNYDYNVAGDLTAIRENGATDWQLTSWYYDNLGRRVSQVRANGATTYWAYNGAGLLAGMTNDLPGTANDLNLAFAYNPAGQIISRTMSNTAYAYAPTVGATSYVNNGKNQVTSVGGSAVTYDARQNIAGAPMGSYAYDGLNQMTSATVSGGTTTFGYDPAGRMVQMGATRLLHDGARPMAEYDASGNVLRRYVPGLDMDETVLSYDGAGFTGRRWLIADERQSAIAYTDSTAAAVNINTYDEYGQPGTGNVGLFQYTGQIWLPQAQIYHYKFRAYVPQLGRFMQSDPVGYSDGANLYGYVGGDPLNWTDPFGLQRGSMVCVEPVVDPGSGEVVGRADGMGAPQCTHYPGSNDVPLGGVGGVLSFVGRGPSDISSRMPGARISRGSVYNDPQFAPYQERRLAAMEANQAPVWIIMAVFAAPAAIEAGAAGIFARACNCFVEGTEVETADGVKPIEQVQVGDLVLARDEKTGETAYKPVVALIAGSEREIWEVTVETVDTQGRVQREPIGTTDEHPWRTVEGRWVETKDLTAGTELVSSDGDRAVVISALKTHRIEPTYNFEVEEFHTYFVGEAGVWVHNACLGNLGPRANELGRSVARDRGASAANVRRMGPWADRTLQEIAAAASRGDRSASTALKIIKQAGRLGQKY